LGGDGGKQDKRPETITCKEVCGKNLQNRLPKTGRTKKEKRKGGGSRNGQGHGVGTSFNPVKVKKKTSQGGMDKAEKIDCD